MVKATPFEPLICIGLFIWLVGRGLYDLGCIVYMRCKR